VEIILSNSTRKLLWFEISKMLTAALKQIYCVICYNFQHTFVPYSNTYNVCVLHWLPGWRTFAAVAGHTSLDLKLDSSSVGLAALMTFIHSFIFIYSYKSWQTQLYNRAKIKWDGDRTEKRDSRAGTFTDYMDMLNKLENSIRLQ